MTNGGRCHIVCPNKAKAGPLTVCPCQGVVSFILIADCLSGLDWKKLSSLDKRQTRWPEPELFFHIVIDPLLHVLSCNSELSLIVSGFWSCFNRWALTRLPFQSDSRTMCRLNASLVAHFLLPHRIHP